MNPEHVDDAGTTTRSMLRWYPARWRVRYGDELAAMIEDDLGGERPTLRYRFSIARSGLHEQLRDIGLIGNSVAPSAQLRAGALTVLCAFALFIIPGVGFAKISEHWDEAFHRGARHLPAVSFNLLASLAVACGAAVVLAAVALLPALVQFTRTGGWPAIRQRVRVAASATFAAGVAGAWSSGPSTSPGTSAIPGSGGINSCSSSWRFCSAPRLPRGQQSPLPSPVAWRSG